MSLPLASIRPRVRSFFPTTHQRQRLSRPKCSLKGVPLTQAAFLTGSEREADHRKIFNQLLHSPEIQMLMKPRDGSFYANFAITFSFATLVIWTAIGWVSNPIQAVVGGIIMGILSGWIGLLAHDVGHGQAPKANKKVRLSFQTFLGPVCLGFSALWWIAKHVTHHLFSNWEKRDGDLNIPLPFTANQAQERGLDANSFRVRHARWIFPLLLPLQAMNARWSSIKYLVSSTHPSKAKTLEWAGLTTYLAWYGGLLYIIEAHAGWQSTIVFFVFHQGMHGLYNACVFATNHKAMRIFSSSETPTWLDCQILTSRNVRVEWRVFQTKYGWMLERVADTILTWVQGALNYQTEHHLFPTMPRCNLRKARPIVMEFCRINGFVYCETGIIRTVVEVASTFKDVRRDLLES